MIFIGVGFGVITGSTLKTIALQEELGQINLPNWLSFKKPRLLSKDPSLSLNCVIAKDTSFVTSLFKFNIFKNLTSLII